MLHIIFNQVKVALAYRSKNDALMIDAKLVDMWKQELPL